MTEKIDFLTIVKNSFEEPKFINKYDLVISLFNNKSCEYVHFFFSEEKDLILFYNFLVDTKENTVNNEIIYKINNLNFLNVKDKNNLLTTISEYQSYSIEKYFIEGYFNHCGVKEKILVNEKINFSFDYNLSINSDKEVFLIYGDLHKSIILNSFKLIDTDDENYILNIDSDYFKKYLNPSLDITFNDEPVTLCVNKETLRVYSSNLKFNNLKCYLKIKTCN